MFEGRGDEVLTPRLANHRHVARTGDIGSFALISEEGIAKGVRRIVAVTGSAAVDVCLLCAWLHMPCVKG